MSANGIFTGDKPLTTANAGGDKDAALFATLGLTAMVGGRADAGGGGVISMLFMLAAAGECDDRNGDLAAAQCWYTAKRVTDDELNKVWPDVQKAARDADKLFSPTRRNERRSAANDLLGSQRAWLGLRDFQCSLEGDYAQGGSLENVLIARRETDITRQRVKQLQDTAAGFREH